MGRPERQKNRSAIFGYNWSASNNALRAKKHLGAPLGFQAAQFDTEEVLEW